jgi:hypothetical protein
LLPPSKYKKSCKKIVKKLSKVVKKLSKSCQKAVKKLSKCCQNVVKKLSKVVKNWPKSAKIREKSRKEPKTGSNAEFLPQLSPLSWGEGREENEDGKWESFISFHLQDLAQENSRVGFYQLLSLIQSNQAGQAEVLWRTPN